MYSFVSRSTRHTNFRWGTGGKTCFLLRRRLGAHAQWLGRISLMRGPQPAGTVSAFSTKWIRLGGFDILFRLSSLARIQQPYAPIGTVSVRRPSMSYHCHLMGHQFWIVLPHDIIIYILLVPFYYLDYYSPLYINILLIITLFIYYVWTMMITCIYLFSSYILYILYFFIIFYCCLNYHSMHSIFVGLLVGCWVC